MSTNVFDKGDLVRLSAIFTDENDEPIDPSSVYVHTLDPAGTQTTYTYGTDDQLVRTDDGDYHIEISVDTVGPWKYRWQSAGTGQAAEEAAFDVVSWFS